LKLPTFELIQPNTSAKKNCQEFCRVEGLWQKGRQKKERENLIANPLDLLLISGRGERI
jgi:hypothetical protein